MVTVVVWAAGGVIWVEVTDCGGRGVLRLRPCGGEAEDGRRLGLVAALVVWWGGGGAVGGR